MTMYVCEIQVSVARSHRLRFARAFGRSACGFHESASGPDGARLEEASARGRKGREDDHASSRLGSGRLDSFVAESGTADKKHKWSGGTRGLCSTCNRGGNGLPPELGEGRPTSSEGKTSTPDNSPDREPCSTDTDVPGTLTAAESSVGEWERELETERKEVTTDRTTDRKEVASSDAVAVCVAGASSDAVDVCVAGASSDAVAVCVVGASSDAVAVCVAGASSDAVDECVVGASSDAVDVCVVGASSDAVDECVVGASTGAAGTPNVRLSLSRKAWRRGDTSP